MAAFSLPQAHKPPPADGCGTCTACCICPGVPELGKPFYAVCVNVCDKGCGIYNDRPQRCADYRCAWHLGWLGPRVDRRPDNCGVILQYEQDADDGNRWYIAMYELVAGAATSDRGRYLLDILLKSKQTRSLAMTHPPVRIYPYGADI